MVAERLAGAAVYLAGPMTAVKDLGAHWREEITQLLEPYGVIVLNPCDKAIEIGVEDATARAELHHNHQAGDYEKVRTQMKIIRRVDLRCVDLASFLICRMDGTPTTGTYEEVAVAVKQQKPVLLLLGGDLSRATLNPWWFAEVDPEFIFESEEELFDYLHEIHTGPEHPSNRKWMLFDFYSLYLKAFNAIY